MDEKCYSPKSFFDYFHKARQEFLKLLEIHPDTEHCFDGDPDTACIGFYSREPYGGFDYVKPEPKKKASFKELFGL